MNIQKLFEGLTSTRTASSFIQEKTCKLANAQIALNLHVTKSKGIKEGDDYLYVFSDTPRVSWVTQHDYSADDEYIDHLACMHKDSLINEITERVRLLKNAGL